MENGYLINGEYVKVLAEIHGIGYLVDVAFVDENGEECYDGFPVFRKQVYEKPPAHKYEDEIGKLIQQIDSMKIERDKIRTEIYDIVKKRNDAKKEETDLFESLKNVGQLKFLKEFIEGKVTHYVILSNYNLSIIDFKDAKYEKWFKMLVLFGDSKGNLAWRLNKYSDGSGSYDDVIPCISYEEALEKISGYIQDKTSKEINDCIIAAAKEYNIPIAPEYLEEWQKKQDASTIRIIEEQQANIEKLKLRLSKTTTP